MTRSIAISLLALAVLTQPVAAQTKMHRFSGGLGLTTTAMADSTAAGQGIGHRAYGGTLNMSVSFFRVLTFSGEVEAAFVSDKRKFTESTTGGTRKSSTNFLGAALATGLRTPVIPRADAAGVTFGVDVGHMWLSGKRGIGDCLNCTEQKLSMNGANYVEPRFAVQLKPNASGHPLELSIAYRKYSSGGDVLDRMMFELGGAGYFGPGKTKHAERAN